MNSGNKTLITESKFLKLLKKNVKRVIAEQGIDAMTRKGDKELDLLVKKIVKQPIQTEEEASKIGEQIGAELVEISRQKSKTNLDKSVIRQLANQKQLLLSNTVSPQETPTTPSVAKSTPKTPTAVTSEPVTPTPVAEIIPETPTQVTSEPITPTPVAETIPEVTSEPVTRTPVAETIPEVTSEPVTPTPVVEAALQLELASSLDEFQHTTEALDVSIDSNEHSAIEDVEELEEDQLLPS